MTKSSGKGEKSHISDQVQAVEDRLNQLPPEQQQLIRNALMEEAGELVVVVRVDCRYRKPAKYDDLIRIHTRIDRVTAGKIIHEYTITRDDETLVDATVTLVVIERDGNLQRVHIVSADGRIESR